MPACYDLNVPIETLFEQITDGVAYAELGEAPFTSKQIVDISLLCLVNTGVFNDYLKKWNRKPLPSRDWTTFRVHFAKAHRYWKANLRLNAGGKIPRVNTVETSTAMTNHQADTVDALDNIATATAADRAIVATLTDTIFQLSSELTSAQAKLISSLLDNQSLLKRHSERGGSWNTSGGVACGETSGGCAAGPWDGTSIHSCHTHGHKCPHPSFKFPEPATGHINNATKKDTRGGRYQEYKKK